MRRMYGTIYGSRISSRMPTVKTTVYLDDAEYRRLKRLAESDGSSAAALIRLAVAEFVDRNLEDALPTWVGSLGSGDPNWASRDEESLDDFGES
jgi:predicted transcriptional regulator